MRLLILTGCRRNEVGGMRRSELSEDGETWSLPGERTKNGLAHIVPLPELARAVIASVPQIDDNEHVFAVDGVRRVNGWAHIKGRLDATIAEAGAPLPGWTFHDCRRTVVTRMIETLGIRPDVVERLVNHVSGQSRAGVAGVYNRAEMLPQRREALEAWAEHVRALVAGEAAPSNVTRLREHA